MYTSKTPKLVKALASDLIWNKSREKETVYLTFDDGPTPGITDKVLELLKKHNSKATFFCVGTMALKFPELLQRISDEGHTIGNHTMNHESGWNTENYAYYKSFLQCKEKVPSKLFRPPYGRISASQAKCLKKHSEIIMWDVLPGDFDSNVSSETCFQRIKKNTQNGSIIVLHDSEKAGIKMLEVLEKTLNWFNTTNFKLQKL